MAPASWEEKALGSALPTLTLAVGPSPAPSSRVFTTCRLGDLQEEV